MGGRVFPLDLGRHLNAYYEEQGVRVLAKHAVLGITPRGERVAVEVRPADGGATREILVDGVVAGIGIRPNVELAEAVGLEVDDGIVVDELLRTSHPDIFAAGDVASFHSPALGRRVRVEHEDNANTMGRTAGRAMAGAAAPYHHLPFFYSDLFELGYEAVGQIDARLEVVADWKQPYREGVLYYLEGGRVRGVLLWNVWGQVDAARRLISEAGTIPPRGPEGAPARAVEAVAPRLRSRPPPVGAAGNRAQDRWRPAGRAAGRIGIVRTPPPERPPRAAPPGG